LALSGTFGIGFDDFTAPLQVGNVAFLNNDPQQGFGAAFSGQTINFLTTAGDTDHQGANIFQGIIEIWADN
jgi:hypothetical protein